MKTPDIGTLETVPTVRLVSKGEDGFMDREGSSEQALPAALLRAGFPVAELVFAASKLVVSHLSSPRNPCWGANRVWDKEVMFPGSWLPLSNCLFRCPSW